MNRSSKIFVLILALSLLAGYFFPIWKIDLDAPQYPEGLGMKIWINKLDGNINTINGLNHYIGMQQIQEQSIPELKYMPYLLGLIIILGLSVSLVGKKWLLYFWVLVFAGLGIAGGTDFYLWEYDYGHNLDPHAAIKIPGMSYQPPLLGNKQLLNFTAHSFPDIGGWIIISAGLLAILLVTFNIFSKGKSKIPQINIQSPYHKRAINPMLVIFLVSGLLISSCEPKEEPIIYGKDMCEFCKMQTMDERFGAEIVTKFGKVYKFDAIECMLHFHKEMEKKEKVYLMLVADASNEGRLIKVDKAFYLHSDGFPSPMSSNISAYGSKENADKFLKEYQGEIISWNKVQEKILMPQTAVNSNLE